MVHCIVWYVYIHTYGRSINYPSSHYMLSVSMYPVLANMYHNRYYIPASSIYHHVIEKMLSKSMTVCHETVLNWEILIMAAILWFSLSAMFGECEKAIKLPGRCQLYIDMQPMLFVHPSAVLLLTFVQWKLFHVEVELINFFYRNWSCIAGLA